MFDELKGLLQSLCSPLGSLTFGQIESAKSELDAAEERIKRLEDMWGWNDEKLPDVTVVNTDELGADQ